jgi:hypothetical protein
MDAHVLRLFRHRRASFCPGTDTVVLLAAIIVAPPLPNQPG